MINYHSEINLFNPFSKYKKKEDVILLAHNLIGTVRGKTANGLMIHSQIFNVVGIVDKNAAGKDTSKVCPGVKIKVPIYSDVKSALEENNAVAIILLIPIVPELYKEINDAICSNLDVINTSFTFIKDDNFLMELINLHKVNFFDLRDVAHLKAYPNTNILKRKAKVVFVTGTDCGLGKRTAAFALTNAAKMQGIKAVMYATGQTGLMLGERGIVIDSLIMEYSHGIISNHITKLDNEGYDMIFVEGQADIFHPAGSCGSLAILHGSNPDCIIMVHDENRKVHKGFEEDSPLYRMHPLNKHLQVLEMLSLPCGPSYKTVGIATIGDENIRKIGQILEHKIPVADVLQPGGAKILLEAILNSFNVNSETLGYNEYNITAN